MPYTQFFRNDIVNPSKFRKRLTFVGLTLSCGLSVGRIIDFAVTYGNLKDVYLSLDRMERFGAIVPDATRDSLNSLDIEIISSVSVSTVFLSGMAVFFIPVKDGKSICDTFKKQDFKNRSPLRVIRGKQI